jgi:hypothetical protein
MARKRVDVPFAFGGWREDVDEAFRERVKAALGQKIKDKAWAELAQIAGGYQWHINMSSAGAEVTRRDKLLRKAIATARKLNGILLDLNTNNSGSLEPPKDGTSKKPNMGGVVERHINSNWPNRQEEKFDGLLEAAELDLVELVGEDTADHILGQFYRAGLIHRPWPARQFLDALPDFISAAEGTARAISDDETGQAPDPFFYLVTSLIHWLHQHKLEAGASKRGEPGDSRFVSLVKVFTNAAPTHLIDGDGNPLHVKGRHIEDTTLGEYIIEIRKAWRVLHPEDFDGPD